MHNHTTKYKFSDYQEYLRINRCITEANGFIFELEKKLNGRYVQNKERIINDITLYKQDLVKYNKIIEAYGDIAEHFEDK